MAICDVCGKGAQVGHNIQHQASGKWRYRAPKTRKVWKANVQKVRLLIEGPAKESKYLHPLPPHPGEVNCGLVSIKRGCPFAPRSD